MSTKVFVDGQEGTTGLQIHERLVARADVELIEIDPALRKDAEARAACLNAADIAFLCLPDEAAKESAALVSNPETCVIDASTAHRTDPAWAFGLPELGADYRKAIRVGKRIANPGCHATAYLLGVRPLVQRGIIPADFQLSCFSLTGYSGGGKKMIAEYQAESLSAELQAPRVYGLGLNHKHLPEMQAHSGLAHAPIFTPIVGNFYQGILVTIPLPLEAFGTSASPELLHEVLAQAYEGETFVKVLGLSEAKSLGGGFLDAQACAGTNRAEIMVLGNAGSGQAAIVVRIDNLGKGASGAAIQSMNLHLGLPEDTGLQA